MKGNKILRNILSLFDGISCGQIALNRRCNYYSSEIDKYAIKITQKNYPKTKQLGDVTTLKTFPKIFLLMGGSPCQDLSKLKNGKGLKGSKSSLIFEFKRILTITKPKFFLLENVVPRKAEWIQDINKLMGVEGVVINSDLFVCQNRPRMYWTNIPISKLPERPKWSKKYYQYRRTYFRENKSGVCPCLTANMGTGGHNVPLTKKDLAFKLTPVDCERLQGIPDNYTEGVSNSQRYKMIGNAWTIPVIKHIFKGLK